MPIYQSTLKPNADAVTVVAVLTDIFNRTGIQLIPDDIWVRICDGTEDTQEPATYPAFELGSVVWGHRTINGAKAARMIASKATALEDPAEMFEPVIDNVRKVLQDWANLQGHARCHWHPEVLQKLCNIVGVKPTVPIVRPPRAEFEEGCRRFTAEEYAEVEDDGCTPRHA